MSRLIHIILLIICFGYLIVGSFLLQHTAWAEMLLFSYLSNHGFLLYKDLIIPYTPLMIWSLNILEAIFGYTPQFSLLFTLFLGITNSALIYFLAKRIYQSSTAGLIGLVFYSGWYFYFEGNGLWFELFQAPTLLLMTYFGFSYLFKQPKRSYLVMFSIFMTISFLIKQPTTWFLLWWIIFAFFQRSERKLKVLIPLVSLFFGVVITLVIASILGYGKEYWYWAYQYSYLTFPLSPGHAEYPTFQDLYKLTIPFSIYLLLIYKWRQNLNKVIFILGAMAALSLSVAPRWGLFHLQPLLAGTALIIAPLSIEVFKKVRWSKPVFIVGILISLVVVFRQDQRFLNLPIRFFEPNVFSLANQLKDKKDLYIFNGPDQVYLINNSLPPVKPYIQNFAWYYETGDLQQQEIAGMENYKPKYLLYGKINKPYSYEIGYYRPEQLADYIDTHYQAIQQISDTLLLMERR